VSVRTSPIPRNRDALRAGATTIIIPIGGTEQNGPHMALGKHNVRAAALSQRIAEKLGNALVAPVLSYVPEGRVTPPRQPRGGVGPMGKAPGTGSPSAGRGALGPARGALTTSPEIGTVAA